MSDFDPAQHADAIEAAESEIGVAGRSYREDAIAALAAAWPYLTRDHDTEWGVTEADGAVDYPVYPLSERGIWDEMDQSVGILVSRQVGPWREVTDGN